MPYPKRLGGISRLNVFALLRDQFRYLRNISDSRPAWLVRGVVLLIAPVIFGTSLYFGWTMQSAGDLVGALGLLAGVFISAFAVVFGVRINLASRPSKAVERQTARLMDESALTLLAAGLLSGVDAMWLAVVSVSIPAGYIVSPLATAITAGISSLVLVYFLLSIRRLHKLYTDTFIPFWMVRDAVQAGAKDEEPQTAESVAARRNA